MNINERIMNSLRHADNTVLVAGNEQGLYNLVEQVNRHRAERGLDINN